MSDGGSPGLTHREPLLDEKDFERFMATIEPLLQPRRDVVWVMAGRTESNIPKLKRILDKFSLRWTVFSLCYNTKLMKQYGHFKRERGMANSKSLEQAFYVYKGRMPKNKPVTRLYVDPGTSLFQQVMKAVPVLHPKFAAFVSREVREASLASMAGIPECDDEEEKKKKQQKDEEEAEEQQELNQPLSPAASARAEAQVIEQTVSGVKKRKLYRQVSGTEVPWFPHDNAPELLKELCHEAGRPRWVFFGTPAGGAGMHGILEMGCSVVALCYDEHHRTHLQRFLVERAVEAMVQGTSLVFKEDSLQARAVDLKLLEKPKTNSGTDIATEKSFKPKAASAKRKAAAHDANDSDDAESPKNKKERRAKKRKTKKSTEDATPKATAKATPEQNNKRKKPPQVPGSDDTSSSDSDSESDEAVQRQQTPTKKSKRE